MKVFRCHFKDCGKSFPRQRRLDDHLNTHTNDRPYRCDMCEKSYMRNAHLTVHRKNHFSPEFRCERCGYMCHTMDRMGKHARACVEHECKVCGKKYRKKAWFEAHVKSHHEKNFGRAKKKYTCEYCKFTFYKQSNLRVHVQSVHLAMRPFRCGCGKEYAHNVSLDRHRRGCGG